MTGTENAWKVAAAVMGAWVIVSFLVTAWLMRAFYRHGWASRQWWRDERTIMLRAYLMITVCGGMFVLEAAENIVLFWWLLWSAVLIKFTRA
jgi:hypothetical protein